MKPKYITISIIIFFCLIALPTYLWMRDYNYSFRGKIDGQVLSNYFSGLSAVIAFASLTISFVLLNVAIKAAKNFDVKKQFHNKQFELVCQLAQEILDTKLSFGYYQKSDRKNSKYTHNKTGYAITFYMLGGYIKARQIDSVYLRNSIDEVLPFLRYRFNPLIPKVISAALTRLAQGKVDHANSPSFPEESLEGADLEELFFKKPDNYVSLAVYDLITPVVEDKWAGLYYTDAVAIQKDADDIRETLLKWFKAYGADDINI